MTIRKITIIIIIPNFFNVCFIAMKNFTYNTLAVCVLSLMQPVMAYAQDDTNEPSVVLEALNATVQKSTSSEQTSQITKTTKDLSRNMVSDSRDLVRHETGITVVENGRFGASGYAVRGVDENRVAISIDGLRQAETLSSQGFKELFEGYGNFNNNRNGVEIETVQRANINKGADSVTSGSGALGGSVMFKTKDARDFLTEKDWHVGYKTGMATADNQKFGSLSLAGRLGKFDALIVATRRDGHELENHGYKDYDAQAQGKRRQKADPYHIKQDSNLLKLSFSPNDDHRFSVMSDTSERISRGHDFSYTLKELQNLNREEQELRHTSDKSKRNVLGFSYENTMPTPLWDNLKLSVSRQKITNRARTDDYCDGNERCNTIANPLGLQIVDNKVVDKNGHEPEVINGQIIKIDGVEHTEGFSLNKRMGQIWFDCSLFDCSKGVTGYKQAGYANGAYTFEKVDFEFDPKSISTDDKGRKFAKVLNGGYREYFLTPIGQGYLPNEYTQRDLNTDTKQLNLELSKYLTLGKTDHQLDYGIEHSITERSMVNVSGSEGRLPQWWATQYLGKDFSDNPYNCQNAPSSDKWNSYLCPRADTYSFLMPVEATDSSVYFKNKIQLHDRVGLDLGYRYNQVRYKPKYEQGVSPKIPDDMVKGLFIPLPDRPANPGFAPSPWQSKYDYDSNHPDYIRDLAAYKAKKAEYDVKIAEYQKLEEKNPAENINYIAQNRRFSKSSYSLGLRVEPLDYLRIQAKYASGFRAPTSDEIYFTFKHPDFTVLPNLHLKPETAKTGELSLTLHGDYGFITTSAFRTDYKNFLDLRYLGKRDFKNAYESQIPTLQHEIYQNVNFNKAKVDGFEINTQLNVGEIVPRMQGLNVSYKLTHQKGLMEHDADGKVPMNAIQPTTSVFGLGYDSTDGKFGGNLYVTRASAKKETDTYNMFWKEEQASNTYAKWRSDDYTLVDLTAYFKPIKNLTLQAGVYNLTDRKYTTWDSARSIRSFGTRNRIDNDGTGIERFYAPERNFKISAEWVF